MSDAKSSMSAAEAPSIVARRLTPCCWRRASRSARPCCTPFWNLAAKRADGDRFVVLWAQFAVSGLIAAVLLAVHAVVVGMPASGYGWAALSGLVHLPYLWLLALAYTYGDFSVSYPLARGGGAALAAALGVALLGDHLGAGEVGRRGDRRRRAGPAVVGGDRAGTWASRSPSH